MVSSPVSAMPRRLSRAALALFGALLLADLGTSLFLIDDGLFFGRPLPPFGALTHPKQVPQLAKMLSEPRGTWTFDAELGWTWRPSCRSEEPGAAPGSPPLVEYVTNALGARGPHEYERVPPSGKRRV